MTLSKTSCHNLNRWFESACTLYTPVSLKKPDATLYTDASKNGWGGVLEDAVGDRGPHLRQQIIYTIWKCFCLSYSKSI